MTNTAKPKSKLGPALLSNTTPTKGIPDANSNFLDQYDMVAVVKAPTMKDIPMEVFRLCTNRPMSIV